MLRIMASASAEQLKNYFSSGLARDDYHSQDELVTGRWFGRGAKKLNLKEQVKQKEFYALADNVKPKTGERLTARNKQDRQVAYDFTFSVPKSVSLLYAATGDERILASFRTSVNETMRALEQETDVRVRKDNANKNRTSGNLTYAEFVHTTARPVNGTPDMHLHAHCVAFNASWDETEKQWKAVNFRRIKEQAPFYEAAFDSRMAVRLDNLGYPVVSTGKGWEIQGFERGTLDKFSRRTQEINTQAEALGIETNQLKATLGARTRSAKVNLTRAELAQSWQSRLTLDEQDLIARLQQKAHATPPRTRPGQPQDITTALDHAIAHEFERQSVVTDKQLLTTALKHGRGKFSPEELEVAFVQHPELHFFARSNHPEQVWVTSRPVMREEQAMIGLVVGGKGQFRPLGSSQPLQVSTRKRRPHHTLSAEQEAAAQHVLGSRDLVVGIRGGAGVGKTTLLQNLVPRIEANQHSVHLFAPTAVAARETLREAGFTQADTVQKLLHNEKLQQQIKPGAVILVDEAGLLGSRDMNQILQLAKQRGARVVLVGDHHQHKSVPAGDAYRILDSQAGLSIAEVKQIRRQEDKWYRMAVGLLSEGQPEKTRQGFAVLDSLGWIHEESDPEQRRKNLVARYEEVENAGESVLVVSPTHKEGKSLVADLRASRKQRGLIVGPDKKLRVQRALNNLTEAQRQDPANFKRGQIIQFDYHAPNFPAGSKVRVVQVTAEAVYVENSQGEKHALPLQDSHRYQVYVPETLDVAQGDKIRITKGGFTLPDKQGTRHRVENNQIYDILGFTPAGDIELSNGQVLSQHYGNLRQGYVNTSHAAQSKTVDRVLILQSGSSERVASLAQYYVSASRGRFSAETFTDDKEALLEAIIKSDERLSAVEALNDPHMRTLHRAELQARLAKDRQIEQANQRARAKAQQKRKTRAREREEEMVM